ncbi:MAG: tetratricopeptide repeat protein [Clostridiaceae bacterium]|jgi:tetratricopeptide (TPR) repeat protein|nr:tetratricopeptide repeat protein [Clostridiaceae bacterium]
MVKKSITIFLGPSLIDFQSERKTIELFIRRMSALLKDRCRIEFELLICDASDDAVYLSRKQDGYNEQLRSSDLSLFIFFTRTGQFAVEGSEKAIGAFRKCGKPKVYISFKETTGEEGFNQSTLEFRKLLEKKYEYYSDRFSDIETVKLRILQALKILSGDHINLIVTSGKIWIEGIEIGEDDLSLNKVDEFFNHAPLQSLKMKLEKINLKYYAEKAKYTVGKLDVQAEEMYEQLAVDRQSLIDEINELEKLIFEVTLSMSRGILSGDVTVRQSKAYSLFERGDCYGCLRILDPKEIDDDYEKRKQGEEEEIKTLSSRYIREYRTRIDILGTMVGYIACFDDITDCYEKITKVALRESIEFDAVYEYAVYLLKHNKVQKSIQIAEKLEKTYDLENPLQKDRATLFDLLGTLYCKQGLADKAEKSYLKSREIREYLAKNGHGFYEGDLALSCKNLGTHYYKQTQFEESIRCFLQAMEIRERLSQLNPDLHEEDLATIYGNLGVLYDDQGQLEIAEQYYLQSKKIIEQLFRQNPDRFGEDLAATCDILGLFYDDQGQFNKAKACHLQSKEIYERLYQANPKKYEAYLGITNFLLSKFEN